MQHIKPSGKGDPLCPLGFHPQVRWPTRCKRCFRDYKEHGNRNRDSDYSLRKDEKTVSSPSLSSWSTTRGRDDKTSSDSFGSRSWTSSSNLNISSSDLSSAGTKKTTEDIPSNSRFSQAASSWTSSPNLAEMKDESSAPTVSFTLPRRRPSTDNNDEDPEDYRRTQYTVRRRTSSSSTVTPSSPTTETPSRSSYSGYTRNRDSSYSSLTQDTTRSRASPAPPEKPTERVDRLRSSPAPISERFRTSPSPARDRPKSTTAATTITTSSSERPRSLVLQPSNETSSSDVEYLIKIKSSKPPIAPKKPAQTSSSTKKSSSSESEDDDDDVSTAGTETTEATLINESELQEQVESMKRELETVKARCEKAEREKSDILLRRVTSYDLMSSKSSASEVLKLQQKVNALQSTVEDLKDDKKSLTLKVRELESDLEKSKGIEAMEKEAEALRAKLHAAETLCEELMDESEDMKKELREMEEEMDEMQDNFREDQADEYTSLKKELEQTAKNCRILSFKLRKAERKTESLEAEKLEAEKKLREVAGGQLGLDRSDRIKKLEQDLVVSNEVSKRLQAELEETKEKLKSTDGSTGKAAPKKKAPMLSALGKSSSGEKMSRETLTRGGSQEDPVQLLRDLQDSMEREADLREQLRFAEEEAQNLRKKASRVEDDNESLVLQLKKMATKARTRKTSPSPSRLTPEPPVEKDEGISDEEDPAELRLLLELNEQEAAVLRRKVEELEGVEDMLKRKVKELQEKVSTKSSFSSRKELLTAMEPHKSNAIYDKKINVLEEEMNDLRKKLLEKERECERLNTELTLTQKKPKSLQKSKSLDTDQHNLDLKRQLQVVEQEASVLRTRNHTLESDNDKLVVENKRLLMGQTKKSPQDKLSGLENKLRITELEKELEEAKKQLELKEEELKTKTGTDNKKISPGTTSEVEKLKKDLLKAEIEKNKLNSTLKRLKEESLSDIMKFYKARTPKKPTDITTKLQMKKMVEDLESEIGEVLTALKKCSDSKTSGVGPENNDVSKYKKEIDDLKIKLENTEKFKSSLSEEKEKLDTLLKEAEKDKKRLDHDVTKITSKTELEKKELRDQKVKVEKEKADLEAKLERIMKDRTSSNVAKEEINSLKKKIESLTQDLKTEKSNSEKIKSQLETITTTEKENVKLSKDAEEKSKKILELENKIKETDEKLKKAEKLLTLKKDKVSKLTKELEETKKSSSEDSETMKSENDAFKNDLSRLEDKIKQLQDDVTNKNTLIETLEGNLRKERERATDATVKAGSAASREISQLREELTNSKVLLQELNGKIAKMEAEKHELEKAAKETESKLEKEVKQWETKVSDLEMEIQTSRKSTEKLKASHEKELKLKEAELIKLKSDTQLAGGKKITEVKQEFQAKVDKLELALASEKREYDDLTAKYEQLEEEHLVMKSKLVLEKESVQSQLMKSQQDLTSVKEELKKLKNKTEEEEESWETEKRDLQAKVQTLERKFKLSNESAETWQLEKQRLNAVVNEKNSVIEQLKKELQSHLQQIDHMHKEIEEYRKKMEDYEKLSNIQRNTTAELAEKDREIKELKNKVQAEERLRKSETAETKLRYENRVTVLSEELTMVQGQVSRFKRERDTFKHMLEAAQKTISDLKAAGATPRTSLSLDDSEEYRGQIMALEQQISCMEDELSEARLEGSRLKTELVSERSAWEIKMSEMTSRLNEMKEEEMLSGGRSKIAGMQSRLQLAWQKEREDQQRLLQETSTLARDLRQTLFEVERERDKERLESKRKLEQLKKTVEEEQEENKKKLTEMQSDLLELRDAHAKLRTTNEKLRRDKERNEKERESLKSMATARRKADFEEDRRINSMIQLVDDLMNLAPDLFPSRGDSVPHVAMPTPPARRKGSKSRETSPMVERRDTSKEPSPAVGSKSEQISQTLQRLTDATQELRKSQRAAEERERARRAFTSRRAGSTESEGSAALSMSVGLNVGKNRSSLRKSLSLDQSSNQDQIWKDDVEGSFSSIQSMDDSLDSKFRSLHRRDPSLDSRLSGGSTQSEVIPSDKKPKKGLLGKLKKLTKSSKSIDHDRDAFSEADTRGSDTSLGSIGIEDSKGSKKDLKERIGNIFKKSGSTSRSASQERKPTLPSQSEIGTDSTQRPLRATSMTRTEPSPARSDVSQSSTTSLKPPTSAVKKVPPNSAPLQRRILKK